MKYILLIFIIMFNNLYANQIIIPKQKEKIVFNKNDSLFDRKINEKYSEELIQQSYDIYIPKKVKEKYDIVFLIHGGSWQNGDKSSEIFLKHKLYYFILQDYIVVSINYRKPLNFEIFDSIEDISNAMKSVLKTYSSIINTNNIIALGNGSGAHLLSLIAVDYEKFDLPKLSMVYLLNSPIYDLNYALNNKVKLFDIIFSKYKNTNLLKLLSPIENIVKNNTHFVLVCSKKINDNCNQANMFANKLKLYENKVSLFEENLSSKNINMIYGQKNDFTKQMWELLQLNILESIKLD